MSKLLDFEKLNNIRDLGGMRNENGDAIASGRLIRCGHLSDLTDNDLYKIKELADTIVDFRTDGEITEKPDDEIIGVDYIHLPIVDSLTAGISREQDSDRDVIKRLAFKPDDAKSYMCKMYRDFVSSEFSVSQYSRFLRILLEKHEKAVLWHCTAGKDRAGIASVIIEGILGVDREGITEDYLMTNTYLAQDIQVLTGLAKSHLENVPYNEVDKALGYLFGADREYIDAFYDEVSNRYGDFKTFVQDGLGCTDEDIAKLKSVYLV